MSLRARLIFAVVVALGLSLALGGTLATIDAARSAGHDLNLALDQARRRVQRNLPSAEASPRWRHAVDGLVASFKDAGKVRVTWSAGEAAARRHVASPYPRAVPPWFVRLMGVLPETLEIPVMIGGRTRGVVTVETLPAEALRAFWDGGVDWLLALAFFAAAVIGLIYLEIGGAMSFLKRLAAALAVVGRGGYGARIEEDLPPSLAPLRDSFNRMSGELGRIAEQNRRLAGEMLTLQEQERNEIARVLHDEVARHLSDIHRDLAVIARAADQGRGDDVRVFIGATTDAVSEAQGQVQEMLGRLRPIGLAEFGLPAAIGNLVEFWRRRHPEILFPVSIAADISGYGETIDLVIYRIVEEALANSLRRGAPTRIDLNIGERENPLLGEDAIVISVADDGSGFTDEAILGYGLVGTKERVRTVGGRLSIESKMGRGLTVTAVLPRPRVGRSAETFLS
jgi:two-component system, NarL family, sensor histidine kinase UhpB